MTYTLSATEQAIFELVDMQESLGGVEGGAVFALKATEPSTICHTTDDEVQLLLDETQKSAIDSPISTSSKTPFKAAKRVNESQPCTSFPKVCKMSEQAAMETEVQFQKNICTAIADGFEYLKEQNMQILTEIKTHNAHMRKMEEEKLQVQKELLKFFTKGTRLP